SIQPCSAMTAALHIPISGLKVMGWWPSSAFQRDIRTLSFDKTGQMS
uniref:Uncharacterized protein n=1 Tax=Oryzias latipes TaxID=8090 RepID=A0A3P9K4B2_ORYLA